MLTDEDRKNLMTKFWQHADFFGQPFRPHPPKIGQVYAFEMSDNTVKIGATSKSEKRIHEVEQKVYLKVLRWHFTDFAPYEFITKTEWHCHAKFDDRRVRGEFFDIPFEEACAELDRYNETFNATLKAADEKFLDEIDVYFNDFLPLYEAHQTKYQIKFVPVDTSAPVAATFSPDLAAMQAQIDEMKSTVATLVDIMKNAPVAASSPDLAALQAQIDELKSTVATLVAANSKETPVKSKEACVYAILLEDDSVKIGFTNRLRARIAEIKSETGLKVKNFYFTPAMPCEDARFIEWACLEKFSSQRIKGEFFSVDFETACRVIDSFVKRFALPSVISDFELAEKLLTIADKISDPVKKETILIEAVNLFVGKKFV